MLWLISRRMVGPEKPLHPSSDCSLYIFHVTKYFRVEVWPGTWVTRQPRSRVCRLLAARAKGSGADGTEPSSLCPCRKPPPSCTHSEALLASEPAPGRCRETSAVRELLLAPGARALLPVALEGRGGGASEAFHTDCLLTPLHCMWARFSLTPLAEGFQTSYITPGPCITPACQLRRQAR